MSSKISALSASGPMAIADVTVIVQSGGNKKVSKVNLLTAKTGESFQITGATGASLTLGSGGNHAFTMIPAEQLLITDGVTQFVHIGLAGTVDIVTAPGSPFSITCSGGQVSIDGIGGIALQPAIGQVLHLAYTPLTPGDWSGNPTSIWEAIDRIAAVVSLSGASPIP